MSRGEPHLPFLKLIPYDKSNLDSRMLALYTAWYHACACYTAAAAAVTFVIYPPRNNGVLVPGTFKLTGTFLQCTSRYY